MIESTVIYLFLGAVVCVIGAVPFGLVNLSVVKIAASTNIQKSMSIAYGAALVEILFAMVAIFAGSILKNILSESIWVKAFIMFVLLISGIYFLIKKEVIVYEKFNKKSSGFFVGVLLNLGSIQVLIFWILAITFLSVRNYLPTSFWQLFLFITGIWITKMAVLRVYAVQARKVLAKSEILSQNLNRIIGMLLILIAFIQFLRF
jgi:threonine/homoserine/homoserine lactone efflux protein